MLKCHEYSKGIAFRGNSDSLPGANGAPVLEDGVYYTVREPELGVFREVVAVRDGKVWWDWLGGSEEYGIATVEELDRVIDEVEETYKDIDELIEEIDEHYDYYADICEEVNGS